MNIILKQPRLTEKSMKLAGDSFYTFLVSKNATKSVIAKAVADQFKVDVLSVRIINLKGEAKMQRLVRKFYRTPDIKKAVVKVKKGQTIPVFEMPREEEEAVVTTAESEPKVIKEKKGFLNRSKVKVEKTATGAAPTTQRKVITGK